MTRNIAIALAVLMACTATPTRCDLHKDENGGLQTMFLSLGSIACYSFAKTIDGMAISSKERDTETTKYASTLRWACSSLMSVGIFKLATKLSVEYCGLGLLGQAMVTYPVVGGSYHAINEGLKVLHNRAANVGAGPKAHRYLISRESCDQPGEDTANTDENES